VTEIQIATASYWRCRDDDAPSHQATPPDPWHLTAASEEVAVEVPTLSPGNSARTRSLDVEEIATGRSVEAARAAMGVALASVEVGQNGHPYYSSAVAAYPAQLWLVVPDKQGQYTVNWIDPKNHVARRVGHPYTPQDIADCFMPRPYLQQSIDYGATVAIITVDPYPICARMGQRGWDYAMLETGQILCRLEMIASQVGLRTRAIGSYAEDKMQKLTGQMQLVPAVTVLMAYEN